MNTINGVNEALYTQARNIWAERSNKASGQFDENVTIGRCFIEAKEAKTYKVVKDQFAYMSDSFASKCVWAATNYRVVAPYRKRHHPKVSNPESLFSSMQRAIKAKSEKAQSMGFIDNAVLNCFSGKFIEGIKATVKANIEKAKPADPPVTEVPKNPVVPDGATVADKDNVTTIVQPTITQPTEKLNNGIIRTVSLPNMSGDKLVHNIVALLDEVSERIDDDTEHGLSYDGINALIVRLSGAVEELTDELTIRHDSHPEFKEAVNS